MDSDSSSHNISVLFVCMGNTCRSPMADFYFKHLIKQSNISKMFNVYSAAVSTNKLANDVCIGTQNELKKHHISYQKREPVYLTKEDCLSYDYIICMDHQIKDLVIKLGGKSIGNKVFKLLDFTNKPMDIIDPEFTNDFTRTYNEISKGCNALFNYLIFKYHIKNRKSIFVA